MSQGPWAQSPATFADTSPPATAPAAWPTSAPDAWATPPLCGAGTFADDATCAVAATGHGEPFIRAVFAHRVSALVELGGRTLEAACREALADVAHLGGTGGVVAVGPIGDPVLRFNSGGMYRGWADANAEHIAIW